MTDTVAFVAHLHRGTPAPAGTGAATIKTPYAIPTHRQVRSRLHRPIYAASALIDGEQVIGARFACGDCSISVSAVAEPGVRGLCLRCDEYDPSYPEGYPVHLYCYFDVDDAPLYVGISNNLSNRHRSHRGGSHWFAEVAEMAILDTLPTYAAAYVAEADAIRVLRPKFNIQHNDQGVAA